MRKVFIFLSLLSPSLGFGASFDCNKAASLSEMMICNDADLSRLDDELSVIYNQAKVTATDQGKFKQQTKSAWLWREKNCQTKECLVSWYVNRKLTLQKMSGPGSNSCISHGIVNLTGFVVSQNITLEPDGRESMVYLLNLKKPVCVRVEPIDIGEARNEMVNRFQLVSYKNSQTYETLKVNLFKEVKVNGRLTTDNVTQYYVESNAIDIISIEQKTPNAN